MRTYFFNTNKGVYSIDARDYTVAISKLYDLDKTLEVKDYAETHHKNSFILFHGKKSRKMTSAEAYSLYGRLAAVFGEQSVKVVEL